MLWISHWHKNFALPCTKVFALHIPPKNGFAVQYDSYVQENLLFEQQPEGQARSKWSAEMCVLPYICFCFCTLNPTVGRD